jgi:hypothetical protein
MIRRCAMLYPKYTLKVREFWHSRDSAFSSTADSEVRSSLLSWLPASSAQDESMEVDPSPSPKTPSETVPETEIYFRLLILHHLLTSPSNYSEAINLHILHIDVLPLRVQPHHQMPRTRWLLLSNERQKRKSGCVTASLHCRLHGAHIFTAPRSIAEQTPEDTCRSRK